MPDLNVSAVVTEEMLAKARQRVGVERPIIRQWHSEATRDTIRHWAEGIGDVNPLWTDPAYARKTKYGRLVAPPSFLFSCWQGPMYRDTKPSRGAGLPGIHRIWAGDSWEWSRHILQGDEIHGTQKLVDIVEHESTFAGRSFEEITERRFFTQRDELLATYRTSFMATERGTAAKRGKHIDFHKYRYSDEELAQINADIDKEVVRGATPRYWEDVQVGEAVPWVVKGPYTTTEVVTFLLGWGGPFMMASEVTHRYLRVHPKANVPDRETNAPDFPERAHWDDAFARECGFPAAYDFGAQRIAWMVHAVTNWQGDDAFLKKIDAKLLRFNVLGDTTWCRGKVVGKKIEGGEHLVELDLEAVNQRKETTAAARAVVRLSSRGG